MFAIIILIPAHPFTSCVTLGRLPNLSEPASSSTKKKKKLSLWYGIVREDVMSSCVYSTHRGAWQ